MKREFIRKLRGVGVSLGVSIALATTASGGMYTAFAEEETTNPELLEEEEGEIPEEEEPETPVDEAPEAPEAPAEEEPEAPEAPVEEEPEAPVEEEPQAPVEEEPEAPVEEEPEAPVEEEPEAPVEEEPEAPVEEEPETPVKEEPEAPVEAEPETTVSAPDNNKQRVLINSGIYLRKKYTEDLTTEKFIAQIGVMAQEIGQENDLYASVMIAQAILESSSGNSLLGRAPYNNLFGIKGSYCGESVSLPTYEDDGTGRLYQINDKFRKYDTLKDSLEDYAMLLTQDMGMYYSGAWKSNTQTYEDATAFLEGRYATDTFYSEKLNALIELYDLTRFDDPLPLEPVDTNIDMAELAAEVTSHLGTPYVWGGTTPDGFDCSGLMQFCYREALGIELPRVSYEQQYVGEPVEFDDLMFGDLLFFSEPGRGTHHVAMYLGDGFYIHAPRTGDVVKITGMDEYTPTFARRVVPMQERTEQ
ncbi:C40 family peptidase [Faecalicatena contorta]|uniref:C40 family peptidase n=1 Tax=Faecalicatena contorta TaxID=39482 RepID=UPI001F3181AF|nr:C40 family peptidase [Faecalicatena contorta]